MNPPAAAGFRFDARPTPRLTAGCLIVAGGLFFLFGPQAVHPNGVVRRTTFHVLALYANLLGSHVGDVFVDSPAFAHGNLSIPALDAVATCDPEQREWQLALVNRLPDRALHCKVLLAGSPLQGIHQAHVLAGDSPDAYNDIEFPERVTPQSVEFTCSDGMVLLPAHSVTLLKV